MLARRGTRGFRAVLQNKRAQQVREQSCLLPACRPHAPPSSGRFEPVPRGPLPCSYIEHMHLREDSYRQALKELQEALEEKEGDKKKVKRAGGTERRVGGGTHSDATSSGHLKMHLFHPRPLPQALRNLKKTRLELDLLSAELAEMQVGAGWVDLLLCLLLPCSFPHASLPAFLRAPAVSDTMRATLASQPIS